MGIAKNYLYNLVLQISSIIIPFITIPYVTRVLDPEGLGIISFTNSVVQYFILFATLGMTLYGNRTIAYVRDDKEKLNVTFWELFYLKLITTFFSIIVYLVFVLNISSNYKIVYYIQLINLLAVAFDISYFFMGIEDFKKVSLRGLLIKTMTLVAIFIIIKEPKDYVLYAIITVFGNIIGQIILWFYLPGYIKIKRINVKNLKKHFISTSKLFFPAIAIQVYTVLDKTMIGILASEEEVAFYDYAQRIVRLSLTLITSLGTVMVSRVSNLASYDNKERIEFYAKKVFDYFTFAAIFVIVTFLITIPDFVPIYFGEKFFKVKDLIIIISPIILFISWSNLFAIQLLVPLKLEKFFTISVMIGAALNFPLNLFLIPRYNSYGASIASVIAEFFVMLSLAIIIRKIINLKQLFSGIWKHFLSGIMTFLIVYFLKMNLIIYPVLKIVIQLILLGLFYITFETIFKSEINRIILGKILKIFRK
ncbi:MAG: polysaccharide biosynthesis protein [Thermosipho sp. (in: Bacteria)]|nr:polysaccharide biosynthesis protein [Thermosipho sp. (in: thermotogales)]